MDRSELKTALRQMLFGVSVSVEAVNSWATIFERAIELSTFADLDGFLNHEIEELALLGNFSQLIEGRAIFMSNTVSSTEPHEDINLSNLDFGLFGVGPGDLQAGDIIVVFAGCEQPLLSRETERGHRLLGDGAMAVLPERFAAHFWSGVEKSRGEFKIVIE